jgi:polysaccharide export outer membrane protein
MNKLSRSIAKILLLVFIINFQIPAWAQTQGGVAVPAIGGEYFVGDAINDNNYKLGPGDQLKANLIVGDNAMSLDYDFAIGPDGKIFFPKIGEIDLLGLTIPEAKKLVNEHIKKVYTEDYTFSFRLFSPRQIRIYLSGSEDKPLFMGDKKYVSVYGEVQKSGRFEYIPRMKFSDYISFAGGPNPRAHLSMATITRQNQKISINGSDVIFNGNTARDVEIEAGDVINIPTQFIYFTDLGSFSTTIFTILALYNTFIK